MSDPNCRRLRLPASLLAVRRPGRHRPCDRSVPGHGPRRDADGAAGLGRCSSASCCGPTPAPARSSSTATSTTAATSSASSAGAATTGRTTPSRTSTTGRSCTRSAAPTRSCRMYKKAWEGHLRQYTLARTTDVPFARDGMYYKEFPVMFDWLHNGEGLTGLQPAGAVRPGRRAVPPARRALRRLLHERGPRCAPTTTPSTRSSAACSTAAAARCCARRPPSTGPATRSRSRIASGPATASAATSRCSSTSRTTTTSSATIRRTSSATTLALNAYMLTHDRKYRDWLLEYVDAWRQRMRRQRRHHPHQHRPRRQDRRRGGGKWYGGVYGWGFIGHRSRPPGELVHRNTHPPRPRSASATPTFLTGDDRYLDAWRKQIDAINAQARRSSTAATLYPHMYGDQGWYDYSPRAVRATAPWSSGTGR